VPEVHSAALKADDAGLFGRFQCGGGEAKAMQGGNDHIELTRPTGGGN
jgi:hypothetical protein